MKKWTSFFFIIIFLFSSPIIVSAQSFDYAEVNIALSKQGDFTSIIVPAGENRSLGGDIELNSVGSLTLHILNDYNYLEWRNGFRLNPSFSVENLTQYNTPIRWNWTTNEPITSWHLLYFKTSSNDETLYGFANVWDYDEYTPDPISTTNTTIVVNITETTTLTSSISNGTIIWNTIGTTYQDSVVDIYLIGIVSILGGGLIGAVIISRLNKSKW